MFSSHKPATQGTHAYRDLAAATRVREADPHRLIALLFEGALSSIGQARAELARGDLAGKIAAIDRALRIVMEGLHLAVDVERGGELAERLDALYEYVETRLVYANRHGDDAALAECARLLGDLASAWDGIRDEVAAPRPPEAAPAVPAPRG